MEKITLQNIQHFNEKFRFKSPIEILSAALNFSEKPILTTSFGTYSAALLKSSVDVKSDIQIIWCDTGYNTEKTYSHAQQLIKKLNLNIEIFSPKYTNAYIQEIIGQPRIGDKNYETFAKIIKLEPFKRAFQKYEPDLWITNIRKDQTSYRENADIFSFSQDGILKVSPFYHYTNEELALYINSQNLPMEFDYFDPLKNKKNTECGIHLEN